MATMMLACIGALARPHTARPAFRRGAATAQCLVLAACAGEPAASPDREIAGVTTLVTAESELLAAPVDLVTDDDGNVYVLDARLARILVVTPTGQVRRMIGREGAGPEELRRPRALVLAGDTLRIVDQGNARVQRYSTGGLPLGPRPLAAAVIGGPLSMRDDGWIAVGAPGVDSGLAAYFDEQGERRGTIGRSLLPPGAIWDFRAIKDQITKGELPAVLRNVVLPVFGENGGLWLAFGADPLVEHYDSTGSVMANVTLTDPMLEVIRREFFERNRREANPGRFYALNYPADAIDIGGTLWLLLQVPDTLPSVLLGIAPDGRLRHRLVFRGAPGATAFAIDRKAGRIYLASSGAATLVSAPIPPGLIP